MLFRPAEWPSGGYKSCFDREEDEERSRTFVIGETFGGSDIAESSLRYTSSSRRRLFPDKMMIKSQRHDSNQISWSGLHPCMRHVLLHSEQAAPCNLGHGRSIVEGALQGNYDLV